MLKISEVAQRLGVNPQTIYFYERIGLIPSPKRTRSGYRLFGEEDIKRLSFITHVKSLGIPLEDIKEILELKERGKLSCEEVYCRLS